MTVAPTGIGVAAILHGQGMAAWDAAVHHPMVTRYRRRFAPVRDVQAVLHPERSLSRELCAGERGWSAWGRPPTAMRSRSSRGSSRRSSSDEIPANLAFLERLGGDPRHGPPAGPSMLPTTYGYTRHLLSVCALGDCAEGLTAGAPVPVELRRAGARRSRRTRPTIRSTPTGSACSATTTTTGWSRETTALLDRARRSGRRAAGWRRCRRIFERSTRVRGGVLGHGVRRHGSARAPLDRRRSHRCVRRGSTKTCRCVWTRSTTPTARPGRGAGPDPRRRRVRDRSPHPRRHDQARSLPDDARPRGGGRRRGASGEGVSLSRSGPRSRSTTRSSAAAASSASRAGTNICDNEPDQLGFNRDGGDADYVVVPEQNAVRGARRRRPRRPRRS